MKTRIRGTVTAYNEHDGRVETRNVDFVIEGHNAPWIDIVDEAHELAFPSGDWVSEDETLTEYPA